MTVENRSPIVFLIYKTLLMDFGISAVRRVFEADLLPMADVSSWAQRYSRIADRSFQAMPFDAVCRLYGRVEQFLESRGVTKLDFIQSLIRHRTPSFLVESAQAVFRILEPIIHELFQVEDVRSFIVQAVPHIHRAQVPGSAMTVVSSHRIGDQCESILKICYSPVEPFRFAYNPDLWKTFIVKESPRAFGAEPFDFVDILAESRSLESIIPASELTFEGSSVRWGDRIIGTLTTATILPPLA